MGGCGWRWNMMELNGTDFGSSTMFQRYDMVWYATCVFLFWYIFGNTRKYVEIDRLWLMDFDRDGHVTFARELWQPDRVNFGHFYGVDFGKFWPANSHKFPWFAGKSPHLFAGRACLGNHLRASSSSQLFLRDLKLRNYQHPHNWLMDIHDIRDIHVYSCDFFAGKPCLMGKSCWLFCRIFTKQRAHRRGGEVSGHAQQRAQRPAQHWRHLAQSVMGWLDSSPICS